MVHAKTVWVRLRTQLTSQVHLSQDTLPVPLPARWTPVVSLRGRAGWQEAGRAARPLLGLSAAFVAAWSCLFVAAFLSAQPPAPLFPPGAVLLAAPEPHPSAALAQRSQGVQHPGLSSRHLVWHTVLRAAGRVAGAERGRRVPAWPHGAQRGGETA